MKKYTDHRPKQTALALALTAALTVTAHGAMAQTISSSSAGQNWTSGNFEVTSTGVIASSASGVTAIGTVGTLTNNGTIGGGIGIFNFAGTISAINNTGSIVGISVGISNSNGAIGTLTNSGTISGSSGILNNTGSIGTLLNNGAIIGTNSGIANDNGTIGTLTNNGTISGGVVGIQNAGSIGMLSNTGTISGGTAAGVINNASIGTLNNSGTIISSDIGIFDPGTIGTLINSGTINGGIDGIDNFSTGTIAVLTNSGLIRGGLSGTSPAAVFNAGKIGTLTNSGTISSNSHAAVNNSGSIGMLNNTGVISAQGASSAIGIVNSGTIGILTNSGTISNQGTSQPPAPPPPAISNSGFIGVLTNNGLITSDDTGIANDGGTIGTLTNNGTISGNFLAMQSVGSIGLLSNNGIIVGSGLAIYNGGNIGTLNNSGTIAALGATQAGSTAIDNNGTIGLLNNSGVIIGGISGLFNVGTMGTLTNTGVISGGHAGMGNSGTIAVLNNAVGGTIIDINSTVPGVTVGAGILNGGTIGRLNNSGTISGEVALYNNPFSSIGTITNSGLIAGSIANHSSFDFNLNGGSGAVFGTLTGFDGTTGTIINTISNLNFGSGNLLLNDNINVGSNLVNNTGTAVLQVNQAVTITGNYNQGAGANLQIGVAGGATTAGAITDTGYGRLVVSGNATIASGSAVTLQSNGITFTAGQRYVVVDTAGTAIYNPGSLNYSINGYTSDVTGSTVANGNNSDLVLNVVSATANSTTPPTPPAPPTSAASIASSPNAVASLTGLLSYSGISNPGLLNLYNAALGVLSQASPATANRIGKQLAPTQTSSASAAPTVSAMNVVGGHVDGLRIAQTDGGSGIATGESPTDWGMWGQGYGGHASQNERDDIDGYNANYSGLLLGVDHAVSGNWRAGGVFSYSNTAVNSTGDTEGDTTRINGYGLIGYASYTGSPWYVNLSGGVTQQQYDTTREVNFQGFSGTANGHFSGQQYVARAEAGYPLALSGLTLTPLASLTYSYQNQGGYTEGGGNGSALSIDGSHVNSVKSSLGASLAKSYSTHYGLIVPDLQVQWIHEFDHTAQVTGASYAADPTGETAFTTVGATPIQDLADVSLGVTLLRANNLSLSVHYELQAGGGFVSQTGSVRVRQVF